MDMYVYGDERYAKFLSGDWEEWLTRIAGGVIDADKGSIE